MEFLFSLGLVAAFIWAFYHFAKWIEVPSPDRKKVIETEKEQRIERLCFALHFTEGPNALKNATFYGACMNNIVNATPEELHEAKVRNEVQKRLSAETADAERKKFEDEVTTRLKAIKEAQ